MNQIKSINMYSVRIFRKNIFNTTTSKLYVSGFHQNFLRNSNCKTMFSQTSPSIKIRTHLVRRVHAMLRHRIFVLCSLYVKMGNIFLFGESSLRSSAAFFSVSLWIFFTLKRVFDSLFICSAESLLYFWWENKKTKT